jgi:hypothetical protein
VVEEDEVILEFFGQLWAIDSPPPPVAARVSSTSSSSNSAQLFWIRRELVEQKSFSSADCFPVRRSDRIDKPAVRISFGEIWSQREAKESYKEVLKRAMADGSHWVWHLEPNRPPPPRN